MNSFDLTNIDDIKELLRIHGTRAKKMFGQNFLVDKATLKKIITAGDIHGDDQVLEIGPGLGTLTHEILKKTKNLTSLEMDSDMVRIVTQNMQKLHPQDELANWKPIHMDALKFDVADSHIKSGYKIIANIPYFITSPLLRHFLKDQYLQNLTSAITPIIPSIIIFLIQKEVAQKIVDKKKESVLGLNIKIFGSPEIIDCVPASSFYPAPKVNSAILKIKVFDKPKIDLTKINLVDFFKLVEAGFSSPRKKLYNNLMNFFKISVEDTKKLLTKTGIDPNLRAERLKIEDWENLTKYTIKVLTFKS